MSDSGQEQAKHSWFSSVTIKTQMLAIAALIILSFSVLAYLGSSGMKSASASLEDLYSQGMQHTIRAGRILNDLSTARSTLLLAFQHDPSNAFATMHDHPTEHHINRIKELMTGLHRIIGDELLTSPLTPEEKKQVEQLGRSLNKITDEGFNVALQQLDQQDFNGANKTLLVIINPLFSDVIQQAEQFLETLTSEAEARHIESETNTHAFLTTVSITVVLSLVVVLGLFSKILKRINDASSQLEDTAHRVADGDLTQRINLPGDDEFGRIARYVNKIIKGFEALAATTQESTYKLAAASEDSATIATQTQQNVIDQQQQTQLVATAIHQFTATVREVAQNASSAAEASQQADEAAAKGQQVVSQSIAMIESLAGDLQTSMAAMQELNAHTEAIGSVVEAIQGISEQTNLLALNAAIEAARAGEQGRGFAVVADEVRTLAKRTQDSTLEIQQTIQSLQTGSREAAGQMDKGTQQAEKTVDMARQAGEALNAIMASVDQINAMNAQIATAAEEQSSVTDEISENITNISGISDQTATGAEQSRTATSELQALSQSLQTSISSYKIHTP